MLERAQKRQRARLHRALRHPASQQQVLWRAKPAAEKGREGEDFVAPRLMRQRRRAIVSAAFVVLEGKEQAGVAEGGREGRRRNEIRGRDRER